MRRSRMSKKQSRKQFKRGAKRVHKKNRIGGAGVVMRGGIRL